MKKVFLGIAFGLLALTATSYAQQRQMPPNLPNAQRASPHDTLVQTVDGKKITIMYGRPYAKTRSVWNPAAEIAPYGKVWRTGADESTIFTTDKAIKIEGKELPAGKYALFTIPGEKEWTVIFNKTPEWGAFTYKIADDVLRVTVPAKKNASPTEQFTMDIAKNGTVSMKWTTDEAAFKIQ